MKIILNNIFLQYLFFCSIFIIIFKLLESKFFIFSKITKTIRNKFNTTITGLIYVVTLAILSTFIDSYFYLTQIQSHILFAFGLSLVCLLIDMNIKKSK
ncbi:hypothetical protein NNC19_01565 [Clostridium sp. SHJSY1]|nr:hypothetical protein [Clostridium sp. SHJSY1]